MQHCAFCEAEATHIIEQTNTPICQSCKEVYKCGQASPDSTFEEIETQE
ncbi:MAG: hypothetical protein V3V85_00510 [Candidatus Thorarchaeota archaeon]